MLAWVNADPFISGERGNKQHDTRRMSKRHLEGRASDMAQGVINAVSRGRLQRRVQDAGSGSGSGSGKETHLELELHLHRPVVRSKY